MAIESTAQVNAPRPLTRLSRQVKAPIDFVVGDLIIDPQGAGHVVTSYASLPGNVVSFGTDTGLQIEKRWYEGALVRDYDVESLDPSVLRGLFLGVEADVPPFMIELGRTADEHAAALAKHLGSDLVETQPLGRVALWHRDPSASANLPLNEVAAAAQQALWSGIDEGQLIAVNQAEVSGARRRLADDPKVTAVFGPAILLGGPSKSGALQSLTGSTRDHVADVVAAAVMR